MRKFFLGNVMWILSLAFFVQCSDDSEPVPDALFDHGVFIVNEGNFTDSDGSLSFYDFDSLKVSNHVFEAVNGRPLAAQFQSMEFFNDRGYLLDGNGRMEVVERKDLNSAAIISQGFSIPRFFEGFADYGFVADWGPYDDNWGNPESKILVIDLQANQIQKELDTPSRPEGMLILDDKLYVANSASNMVTVYDPVNLEVIDSLEVNHGPTHFVKDKNGDLWVISTGAFISGGALQKIDPATEEVISTTDLGEIMPNGKLAINGAGDILFFMGEEWAPDYSYTDNKIYKTGIDQPGNYQEIISERNLYGLGVDPGNDDVYVSDAVGFQGNGKVYVYDFTGLKKDEYTVGRGPNGFVFTSGY